MEFEKRHIPLLVIVVYGIVIAFNFLNNFTSFVLNGPNPDWDMILFFPGLADIDNLYLVFGSIIWIFVVLLCSTSVAGIFILINRLGMRSRTQSVEAIEPKMSFIRLITRAVIPAMFSFSIGEIVVEYLGLFSVGIFQSPGPAPPTIQASFDLFLARTLHLFLIFLPLTLAIFIPTWILNDFMVVSRRKDTKSGEYSDPVKVGQWISGLLSGFSLFAFPLAFLNRFLFNPLQNFPPLQVLERLPLILLTMANVVIIFIAYAFLAIILYEAGRSSIAKWFYKVADKLNVEKISILLSANSTPASNETSMSTDET